MQQMYWNFLMDLEKFGFASQRRPRMRAFGRSVTRPKDSFSVTFELAAKDDGKVNRQNPIALPRVCVCVSLSVFWRTSSVKVSICSSSNLWYRIPPCFSTWISRAAIFSSSFADCSPVDASVAHKKWIESTSLCPTSLCLVDPAGKFDAHVATSWDWASEESAQWLQQWLAQTIAAAIEQILHNYLWYVVCKGLQRAGKAMRNIIQASNQEVYSRGLLVQVQRTIKCNLLLFLHVLLFCWWFCCT